MVREGIAPARKVLKLDLTAPMTGMETVGAKRCSTARELVMAMVVRAEVLATFVRAAVCPKASEAMAYLEVPEVVEARAVKEAPVVDSQGWWFGASKLSRYYYL